MIEMIDNCSLRKDALLPMSQRINKIIATLSMIKMNGEFMTKNPTTNKMKIPSNCVLALFFILADVQKNNKTMVRRGENNNE